MASTKKVVIQIKTQIGYSGSKHKCTWTAWNRCNTYEEAVECMKILKAEEPEATFRIKHNNEYTY